MGVLKYYNTTTSQWERVTNNTLGSVVNVTEEIPSGVVDGNNGAYTTLTPYTPGSLMLFINGLRQSKTSGHFAETNPATGAFTVSEAPKTGDNITVAYMRAVTTSGNAEMIGGYTINGLVEALYPIGSIYVSGSNTLPPLIAGIGTWTRLEGVTIVGASDSDTEFTNGSTGGSKTHTHNVPLQSGYDTSRGYPYSGPVFESLANDVGATIYSKGISSRSRNPVAGSLATANIEVWRLRLADTSHMNPYKAKFMWERTA